MSDEQTMPSVIYASDSSCDMMYGKWWRSKELDHYTPYLRCDIDPDDAVVVSKAHEDMDALSIAYMKGKRRGQALSRATIATLTAERDARDKQVRELVEEALALRTIRLTKGTEYCEVFDQCSLVEALAAQLKEQDDD
jgi:hypothetical protein